MSSKLYHIFNHNSQSQNELVWRRLQYWTAALNRIKLHKIQHRVQ